MVSATGERRKEGDLVARTKQLVARCELLIHREARGGEVEAMALRKLMEQGPGCLGFGANGFVAQTAQRIGLGAGNVMTSAELRQMRQAGLMLSDAWLRYTSGAAVPEQEVERFAESFIPRAGDDPTTLAQKKASRAVIIEALRRGAGRALDPAAVGTEPNITELYGLERP
jgi:hypothetical protein